MTNFIKKAKKEARFDPDCYNLQEIEDKLSFLDKLPISLEGMIKNSLIINFTKNHETVIYPSISKVTYGGLEQIESGPISYDTDHITLRRVEEENDFKNSLYHFYSHPIKE